MLFEISCLDILRPVEMNAEQVLDDIFAGEDFDGSDFVLENEFVYCLPRKLGTRENTSGGGKSGLWGLNKR